MSPDEVRCLSQKQIFWINDGNCYPLLSQGPCLSNEWLVASEVFSRNPYLTSTSPQKIKISCVRKVCPCLGQDPDFCEIEIRKNSGNSGNCRNCVVALAAEQDGICDSGEQLFNSPFGYGICGCRKTPQIHVNWPIDGACYPLHEKGPCYDNETLHWIPEGTKPVCVPTICPIGKVLSIQDGRCHELGSQGIYILFFTREYTQCTAGFTM
jgi:hypothetical protein